MVICRFASGEEIYTSMTLRHLKRKRRFRSSSNQKALIRVWFVVVSWRSIDENMNVMSVDKEKVQEAQTFQEDDIWDLLWGPLPLLSFYEFVVFVISCSRCSHYCIIKVSFFFCFKLISFLILFFQTQHKHNMNLLLCLTEFHANELVHNELTTQVLATALQVLLNTWSTFHQHERLL